MTLRVGFAMLCTLLSISPCSVAQSPSSAQPLAAQTEPGAGAESSSSEAPAATAPGPSAPLIERARYAAFQFSQKLPNFICQEYIARYAQRGEDKRPLDIVQADVVYSNGEESYHNVRVGGRPTNKGMMDMEGSRSTGEFATMLLNLFAPATNTQFRSGGRKVISGSIAEVYDFQVLQENSHWEVKAESQSMRPGYKGAVWIDPATARVLRIEMEATDIPPDFPMDRIESAVDYAFTTIAGNSSLLPVHAESLGCQRSSPDCSHNVIDFRNYHQFKADVKIR